MYLMISVALSFFGYVLLCNCLFGLRYYSFGTLVSFWNFSALLCFYCIINPALDAVVW